MYITFCAPATQGCATVPLQNFNVQIIIAAVHLHPIHTKFGTDG
uniref:Uncharacterized protein n=1 Tax=Anguilla anguilla TaxID=7936 RepID=A0A0E9VSC0_ANGAN